MPQREQLETRWQHIARVIQAELAFYPGRASLIWRRVLACTIVMVFIMVFRMPGAALGAYYPMLLSWDNPRAMRRSALRIGMACVLGTAEIILGAMFFIGSPFLHLVWVAASLFLVFYLISSMKMYDAALALGLTIATGITTWDLTISPERRLHITLFTMLSILIGCAVSMAIEHVFAHTHPPDTVLEGLRERLMLISEFLNGLAEGRTYLHQVRAKLSGLAMRGTGSLRERLAHSIYDSRYRERLAAALALSDRIVNLASHIDQLDPRSAAEDRSRCVAIAASIDGINAHLAREEAPGFMAVSKAAQSYTPLLFEIERNVDLLSQCLTDEEHPAMYHLPEPGEERQLSIFRSDIFTNRDHLRFAIRGSLSAFACYLIYMSVGWHGLGASTATCVLTALTNTGASRHKQLLRFAGIILGACVLGFASQAIILPQIDSLFAFSLLFASVIAIGAWVGTSGPRIAFAGIQIVLAYDLVNLNHFTITTSLVPARDTVLGIMLGIFAMWLIFDHLWATSSTESIRTIFLDSLHEIAQLRITEEALPKRTQLQRLLAASERLNAQLDRLRSLIDFSVFEPHSDVVEPLYSADYIKSILPQLRCFLLLKVGLLHHQILSESLIHDQPATDAQRHASEVLLEITQTLINGHAPAPLSKSSHGSTGVLCTSDLHASSESHSPAAIQRQLTASLLNVAQQLREDLLVPRPLSAFSET